MSHPHALHSHAAAAAVTTTNPVHAREASLDVQQRTQLIGIIASLLRRQGVPEEVHQAALTLMGWLAQRKLCEKPCQRGLVEARRQCLELHSE